MKREIFAAAVAAALAPAAQAASETLEEVTIIGSREAARVLPGSGAVVDSEQIRVEAARGSALSSIRPSSPILSSQMWQS
jgi:Fe(3+) dicitrate transport protein